MALDHRPVERAELRRRLLISLVVAIVAIVAVAVVGAALDWTLAVGSPFDSTITTDPAGDLPF